MDRKTLRLRRNLSAPTPAKPDTISIFELSRGTSALPFGGTYPPTASAARPPEQNEFTVRADQDGAISGFGLVAAGAITTGRVVADALRVPDGNGGTREVTFEQFSANIAAANPPITVPLAPLNPADVSPERRARNRVRVPRSRGTIRAESDPFYSIDRERAQGHIRELEAALLPTVRRCDLQPGTLFTPQQASSRPGSVQQIDVIYKVAAVITLEPTVHALALGILQVARAPNMTEYVHPIQSARWVERTYKYDLFVDRCKPVPERMWRRVSNAIVFTIARLLGIESWS